MCCQFGRRLVLARHRCMVVVVASRLGSGPGPASCHAPPGTRRVETNDRAASVAVCPPRSPCHAQPSPAKPQLYWPATSQTSPSPSQVRGSALPLPPCFLSCPLARLPLSVLALPHLGPRYRSQARAQPSGCCPPFHPVRPLTERATKPWPRHFTPDVQGVRALDSLRLLCPGWIPVPMPDRVASRRPPV